jgi:hypothetical protein
MVVFLKQNTIPTIDLTQTGLQNSPITKMYTCSCKIGKKFFKKLQGGVVPFPLGISPLTGLQNSPITRECVHVHL